MRIFRTKAFTKWAKKHLISDSLLKAVASEIEDGIFEANLGGYVLKKRIATKGRGKSSSVRTIIAFKKDHHCFFMYGFEKNEKTNITSDEARAFKLVAKQLLAFSESALQQHIKNNVLYEVLK